MIPKAIRIVFRGILGCAVPGMCVLAQVAAQPSAPRVLVTPLLHAGALSDSLARLLRQELAGRYHLALVPGGDVAASLQRTDSTGQGWTFESVRDLANSFKADALVDIGAVRVADSVQVRLSWGRAPFTIIDNTYTVTQASFDVVAHTLAQQITRHGWPAADH